MMKRSRSIASFFWIGLLTVSLSCAEDMLPSKHLSLDKAEVKVDGRSMVLQTGRVRRELKWTGHGWLTVALADSESGQHWIADKQESRLADWQLPGQVEPGRAVLKDVVVRKWNDDGFASEFIEVMTAMEYPNEKLALRWKVWVWPDAPGFRTQLEVKALPGYEPMSRPKHLGIDRSRFKVAHVSSATDKPYISRNKEDKKQQKTPTPEEIFDGNPATGWVSAEVTEAPTDKNEIVVDMGAVHDVRALGLFQLDDYHMDGLVKEMAVYLAEVSGKWGEPVATATLERAKFMQQVEFNPTRARFIKLVMSATTKKNHNRWLTRLGELYVYSSKTPLPVDSSLRMDFAPCSPSKGKRITAGLYADTQNRNEIEDQACKEVVRDNVFSGVETVDWANIAAVEQNGSGLLMVKESHKAVNVKGLDTGSYHFSQNGLENSGWGRLPQEITDDWGECWAGWLVIYSGGASGRAYTLKQFDRIRFGHHIEKDYLVKVNTWGTHHHSAATEAMALKDLPVAKEMGVEDFQIDDGWQTKTEPKWRPDPTLFPKGWKPVREKAKELGIQLSLWQAVMDISPDALRANFDEGGFVGHKLDFANFSNRKKMDDIIGRVRAFIKYTDHVATANWDVTEAPPRFGYFWAREYGRLWLKNAKPQAPPQTIYEPNRVLADAWWLSKYMNMRKIELPMSNPKQVKKEYSDAYLHPEEYLLTITFAGAPVFFESLYPYTSEQRVRVRSFLDLYKQYRKEMWECIELPIGAPPNNRSITGFQLVGADKRSGYLLIFRERLCSNESATLMLHFAGNESIQLTDLIGGSVQKVLLNNGLFPVSICQAPGFRWYRYQLGVK